MIRNSALLALLLLPVFFLLHNYNELFGFIQISQLIMYGILIYGIILVAYFILRRFKLSETKAGLILFIICFFNLFFDPIDHFFKLISFKTIFGSYLFLFPLWILLIVLLIRKITRTNISSKVITFMNVVMLFLVASELITGILNFGRYQKNHNLIYSDKPLSENYVLSKMADTSKPDIYFIVFDEYTNNKSLKKLWNFDNNRITNWLSANDFYVPTNTHANYTFTIYSVSSTFNMNYIDARRGSDGTITRNLLQANQSLSNNEAFSILQKENYAIDFLAPFKNIIKENGLGKWFDYLIDHQIGMQTLPGKIVEHIKWYSKTGKWSGLNVNDASKRLDEKVVSLRSTMDQIKSTTDSTTNRRPHFVYGHFMTPHEPHLSIDSTGTLMPQQTSSVYPLVNTYTAQIGYANNLMKELVTYIKQHNKHNTIIIIEGDHGFRQFLEGPEWFQRTSDSMKKYFLPNFNAVYFPDKNYSHLYDTMSPVNTFRIVFNQYFNQNFPLLKDSGTVVKDE